MTKDEAIEKLRSARFSSIEVREFIKSQAKEIEQLQLTVSERGRDILIDGIEQLESQVKQLQAEIAELKKSNTILQHNHSNLMSDHAELEEAYAELKAKLTDFEHDMFQAAMEIDTLKAKLEHAIVPKYKIGQEVYVEAYGEGIVKTKVGLIQFDGDNIEYNVYTFTEEECGSHYCNYDQVPESELFATKEAAQAGGK